MHTSAGSPGRVGRRRRQFSMSELASPWSFRGCASLGDGVKQPDDRVHVAGRSYADAQLIWQSIIGKRSHAVSTFEQATMGKQSSSWRSEIRRDKTSGGSSYADA